MEGIAVSNRGLHSLTIRKLLRPCKLPQWHRRCQFSPGLQQVYVGVRARSVEASGMNAHHDQLYKEADSTSTSGAWAPILRSRALRVTSPETSLREGQWVKLICGASFEDVAEIRNLSLVYTLAGVDCIDCAADTAVVAAVVEGVNAAQELLRNVDSQRPWIMISVNDDVDQHFRKAEFNSEYCPSDCPRPCERVCPALAILFQEPNDSPGVNATPLDGGVIMERCYGCGRCLTVCPMGLISARTYVRPIAAVANLLLSVEVDAIEIHTGAGRLEAFQSLVSQLGSTLSSLKLVAVSVPDLGEAMIPAMVTMYTILQPFMKHLNLWQLDGRPMSGDIGAGATRAAVALAARVAASADRPQGYLQLAGGTNAYTVTAMKKGGLCGPSAVLKPDGTEVRSTLASPEHFQERSTGEALIAGVGYGGYARKVVSGFLQKVRGEEEGNLQSMQGELQSMQGDLQSMQGELQSMHGELQNMHGVVEGDHHPWKFGSFPLEHHPGGFNRSLLEHYPSLLLGALQEAITLVNTVKNAKFL